MEEHNSLNPHTQYYCSICDTKPDQLSHHKSHLETEKHKDKTELFQLRLSKLSENELLSKYKEHIEKHNNSILFDDYSNAGFDLFVPKDYVFDTPFKTTFIDLEIKTEMVYCDLTNSLISSSPFNVHPRSSISKTPLMLANHTGIIDQGYRGSLIGAFRWLHNFTENNIDKFNNESSENNIQNYTVEKNTRLLQICHASLCPVLVYLVDENKLSSTIRGEGSFGSTGK